MKGKTEKILQFHPTVETLQLHRCDDAGWVKARLHPQTLHPELELREAELFDPEGRALKPWHVGDPCPPLFYETQNYELVVELKDDVTLAFHHDNLSVRESVLPKGRRLLSGVLNFKNEVGYTELELRREGKPVFRLQLEIFPSKMDDQKDYEAILREVNGQVYNLSFDFLRRTYQLSGLKETRHQSLTEFFVILQHVFRQLAQTVERMGSAPHHRLRKKNRQVDAARVQKAGRENLAFLAKRPHLLARDDAHGVLSIGGQRYSPTQVLETRRHVDYDTLENRFVRWVLVRVQRRLRTMQLLLSRKEQPDPVLIGKLAKMQNELGRLLQLDFLRVGELRQMTVSLVLQMAPGYRDVYRYYLMLMKGLSIQDDLFRLSMKDLAQLYEYWCFLKIHELLSRKYELVKQDVVKLNRGGLFVTLEKGRGSRLVYRNPRNGEVFTLYYNSLPIGDGSATVSQKPDNVLTLKKQDASVEYKYVFDAKYRINPAYAGTAYRSVYGTPGPQEDDINTMHRYRDAIVYESAQRRGGEDAERTMFGAFVLFPYPNEAEYAAHKFYKSIELVNVGALPFLPSATSLVEKFLDELILDSPEKAQARATVPRGTEQHYREKRSGRNALVVPVRSRAEWLAARETGCLEVPLSLFGGGHGQLKQVERVAMLRPADAFGLAEQGIHESGVLRDWQVVRREGDDELVVRFQVEAWNRLIGGTILPGAYGVERYLLTSTYLLDRASSLAELWLTDEPHLSAWRELRRQGAVAVELDERMVDRAARVVGMGLRGR